MSNTTSQVSEFIPIEQAVNPDSVVQCVLSAEADNMNKFNAFIKGRDAYLSSPLEQVISNFCSKKRTFDNICIDNGQQLVEVNVRAEPISICQDGIPNRTSKYFFHPYFDNVTVLPGKLCLQVMGRIDKTVNKFVKAVIQHQRDNRGGAFDVWQNVPNKPHTLRGDCSFDLMILENQARIFMTNWLITAWLREQPYFIKQAVAQKIDAWSQVDNPIVYAMIDNTNPGMKLFVNSNIAKRVGLRREFQATNTRNPCIPFELQHGSVEHATLMKESILFNQVNYVLERFAENILDNNMSSFNPDWSTNMYWHHNNTEIPIILGNPSNDPTEHHRRIKSMLRKQVAGLCRQNMLSRINQLDITPECTARQTRRGQIVEYSRSLEQKVKWPCAQRNRSNSMNLNDKLVWGTVPYRMGDMKINNFMLASMHSDAYQRYDSAHQKAFDNYTITELFDMFGNLYLPNRYQVNAATNQNALTVLC